MDNYIVYHLHTDISNVNGYMDSCTNYKDYIKLAKEQKMTSISFSDHGGMYDWVKKKRDCDKAGIKYIHGIEAYLCTELEVNERGYHIGLYAKNYEGVKELNALYSLSTSKGTLEDKTDRHFYYNPRISLSELMNTSSNIIVVSACLASMLWKPTPMLLELKKINKDKHFKNKVKKITHIIKRFESKTKMEICFDDSNGEEFTNTIQIFERKINILKKLKATLLKDFLKLKNDYKYLIKYRNKFLKWMSENKDRCFLEIQYHSCDDQIFYNQLLYKRSQRYGIRLIAGTDTHSSTPYKAECRKILQKSKGCYYDQEYEFDLIWKTYDELIDMFREQDALPEDVFMEAIHNTNVLADMVEEFELDESFKYPNLYGKDAIKIWSDTIRKKFEHKIKNNTIDSKKADEYKQRINEEFIAMKKQGMESFMMFMSELADHCNESNIPYGFCRGSVGGSLVAYITDITDVDPIVWNTVFSRFCNADRISLGDIDLDFSPEDRIKVYDFITDKFTPQKIAYILTMGTAKDRSTIDILAKGLDYTDLDAVMDIKNEFDTLFKDYSKIIQEEVNIEEIEELESSTVDFDNHDLYVNKIRNQKALDKANTIKSNFEKLKQSNEEIFYYFDGIKGTIISKGQHPAGIIGSPITLPDNLGVFYKNGDTSHPISICSMKPVDSLNFVKFDILGLKTIGIIKDAYNYIDSHYLKSHEIDWNDKKVWDNMTTSPIGIFQMEGDFAFNLLKKFKPRYVNDLSLINAALRPSGKSYRDRLIAGEINKNPSEQIDELLKNNYGYLVFQEDTIKFLSEVCGFTGSQSDTCRRYIGKKMIPELKEMIPKILEGYCEKSDKPRDIAEKEAKQFLDIIDASSEYQFGYNHSQGYSMIGYACVRLRTYYPLALVAAYLNRAETQEDIASGTNLAQQLKITVNPIRFRGSKDIYMINKEENSVYKGMRSIKYCNSIIAGELFDLKDNQYNSFMDLLLDAKDKTSTNSRQLDILIKLDYFSEFGKSKVLCKIVEYFVFLKHGIMKQISLKKLDGFLTDIIPKYSTLSPSGKTYSNLDMKSILPEVESYIRENFIDDYSTSEKIKSQEEFLGYMNCIYPINKKYVYVSKIETKYSPKLECYCLNNGKCQTMKVQKKLFNNNNINKGDFLSLETCERKPRMQKTDNGFTTVEDEFDWWIRDYKKVDIDKIINKIE